MENQDVPVILGQFEGSLIKSPGRKYHSSTEGNPRWDYGSNRGYCDGWYFWGEDCGRKFIEPSLSQLEKLCLESRLLILTIGYNVTEKTCRLFLEIAKRHPDKVYLLLNVEEESHPKFPNHYLPYRKAAMTAYNRSLMDRMKSFSKLHGGRKISPAYLKELKKRFRYHYCAWPTALWSIHHYYEMGYDLVMREVGAWYSNSILNFSVQRGGARQYGKRWGMWLSTWGGPRHRMGRCCSAYDIHGRHLTGLSADIILLHYITAWLSGADVIMSQDTLYTHWATINPVIDVPSSNADLNRVQFKLEKPVKPPMSPTGRKALEFSDFIHSRVPKQAKAVTPFALLLDPNHGFETSGVWQMNCHVWRNRVPYEQGDFMLDHLFNWLYPGYRLSGRGFMKQWNAKVNWTGEKEYCDLMRHGWDQRPYEHGYLCPTRYGDSFDILVNSRLTADSLSKYKVVILAGGILVDARLMKTLRDYCENGGTVIVFSRQFVSPHFNNRLEPMQLSSASIPGDDILEDFLGIRFEDPFKQGFGRTSFHSPSFNVEDLQHEYLKVELSSAKTVAVNSYGDPLITSNRIGKGRLFFLSADYGLILGNHDLLESTKHFLDSILKPLLPVSIEGPMIQYHVMQGSDCIVAGLINSTEKTWTGRVVLDQDLVKCKKNSILRAIDIWRNRDISNSDLRRTNRKISVKISIPAFYFSPLLFS